MERIYEVTDPDLPDNLKPVKMIFYPEKDSRQPNESLHDYLTRKHIACFCKSCIKERKKKSQANNTNLF